MSVPTARLIIRYASSALWVTYLVVAATMLAADPSGGVLRGALVLRELLLVTGACLTTALLVDFLTRPLYGLIVEVLRAQAPINGQRTKHGRLTSVHRED